jgi:hypothetical protein
LTSRQLLSREVEARRRELLANQRERWESRREIRELKWEALAILGEQLRVGGCDATAAEVERQADRKRRAALYAAARVRALSRDLTPRVLACGSTARFIRCRCSGGASQAIPVGCRQRLACEPCRKLAAHRARKRLLEALPLHRAAWKDSRGRQGALRLLTLTARHSGDLAADREALYAGWLAVRKAMHRWYGRALPFSLVWETTPGDDDMGHVHAHVLVVGGPRFWRYAAIRAVWCRAVPSSESIDIKWIKSTAGAAKYVAKYISKGTALDDGMSDEVAAQMLAASYGKRSLWCSLRFWAPPDCKCRDCGDRFRPASRPPGYIRVLGRKAAELWCRDKVLRAEMRDEHDRPVWYEPGAASIGRELRKLGVQ